MHPIAPFNLPTLAELFTHNDEMLKRLREKGFKTVPALMMLSLEDNEERGGLDKLFAAAITMRLFESGIAQRVSGGPALDFIESQWDGIEDAPIGILQAVIDHTQEEGAAPRDTATLEPLEIISLMEDVSEHLTIGDLVRMTPEDVRTFILGGAVFGLEHVPGITEEIEELNARLEFYSLSLSEPQTLPSRRRLHLRSI